MAVPGPSRQYSSARRLWQAPEYPDAFVAGPVSATDTAELGGQIIGREVGTSADGAPCMTLRAFTTMTIGPASA
jgi:hypothetical protein